MSDRDQRIHGLRAVLTGELPRFTHEYPCHAPDTERWFQILIAPLRDEDTNGAVMMHVDITERELDQRRIAEQAALLDNAQDAILVRDLEGRIQYLNRRAEQLYGWSRDEALGQDARELQFADHLETFERASERTLRDGEWTGDLDQVSRDGKKLVTHGRWSLLRREDGSPRGILAINTDVSEQRRLEQQVLRTQRLESIGTLAGGIAHDLNNVLAPILMSIGLMRLGEEDPQRLEDLETIEVSAKRGAEMVRQLLTFARGLHGERDFVDVGRIVREVARILRDTFPKNIETKVAVVEDLWQVSADATQINQLLMNLCVNARDAMPSGGTLSVTVRNVVLDEVYAGMNPDAKPGDYVLLEIEDTGAGMPPEVVERAFEPFFTTKETGKGTGLGLSTTHAIVKSHGGLVTLYSEPGRGTRFHVYLPAEESERVAVDQTRLPRGNGELVLVVDDEEAIRRMVERTLRRFGYDVVTAAHGAEAVALFARRQAEVDVVLTDMAMPVMDGPSTIVALRSIDPQVRIIGSSGLDVNGTYAKAVQAGTRHFVPKPYTAETLLRTIREVLTETDDGQAPVPQ